MLYIIAGLGNPGLRYRHTRHNAGFEVIDLIGEKYHIPVKKWVQTSMTGRGEIEGVPVMLVKPQTYMNLSGESISSIVRYHQVNPETNLIVISDDVALPPGSIRIRKKGSAGGHNGLQNIIDNLGTERFLRVRMGVGDAEAHGTMVRHVLARMPKEDREKFNEAVKLALEAVVMVVKGDPDGAMNKYNRKLKPES